MCSSFLPFVAFSDGKPVSIFPENALARISHANRRIEAPNQRKLFCENDFARFEERPDADRL
jgi:hypothetical protein